MRAQWLIDWVEINTELKWVIYYYVKSFAGIFICIFGQIYWEFTGKSIKYMIVGYLPSYSTHWLVILVNFNDFVRELFEKAFAVALTASFK